MTNEGKVYLVHYPHSYVNWLSPLSIYTYRTDYFWAPA